MTALDTHVIDRLAATRTIDLTTTGRSSGTPSRIEIWWFHVDGRFLISGTPGPRDWMANVQADPSIVVHTRDGDFPGTARVVTDPELRRRFFTHPEVGWYRSQADLDRLVATAPMIEIEFG
jgi:deazaflavin-dependent oxidoreductase (nitroreductase family)